jgi:hypothetical protein
MKHSLRKIREAQQLESLRERFQRSRANILRMASREGVQLTIPLVLPDENAMESVP